MVLVACSGYPVRSGPSGGALGALSAPWSKWLALGALSALVLVAAPWVPCLLNGPSGGDSIAPYTGP